MRGLQSLTTFLLLPENYESMKSRDKHDRLRHPIRMLVYLLVALSISVVNPPTTMAEGRAEWMRSSRWGLMTHYLPDWIEPQKKWTSAEWNKLVDEFDVEGLARQLEALGAKYYLFTIGQNSGFYVAPNATYDQLVGTTPSKCSRRDLIKDLSDALSRKGIRLLVYLPSGAPSRDRTAVTALEWKNGPYANREFSKKWERIIREWSLRWGSRISGWWFDGCYWPNTMYRSDKPPNFASLAAAARAGNPRSVVAFNPGVVYRTLSITPEEDYIAGEIDHPDRMSIRRVFDGKVDGAQLHMLSYLGETWGRGKPRFTVEQISTLMKMVIAQKGSVTWDVPVGVDGLISPVFFDQLKSVSKSI